MQECKFGLSSPLRFDCGTVASSQHLWAINIKRCEIQDTITLPSLALYTCLWQVCGWQNLTFKSFYDTQFYLLVCWNFQSAYWKNNTSMRRSILAILKGLLSEHGGAHRLHGKTWHTQLGQSWNTMLVGNTKMPPLTEMDSSEESRWHV